MTKQKVIGLVIAIVCVVFALFLSVYLANRDLISVMVNRGYLNKIKIEPNEWQPVESVFEDNVDSTIIQVSYNRKYGKTVTIYCTALFYNKKEKKYKAVSPWLGSVFIIETNTTDIFQKKIPISEAPESYKELKETSYD